MTAGPYAFHAGCYCGSCELSRAMAHAVEPAPRVVAAWEIA